MDVFEAIKTRRSSGFVTQAPVDPQSIQTILKAACWAPNHKCTEPWWFHVFEGEGRAALAKAIAAEKGSVLSQKVYRAPVVIAVVAHAGRSKADLPLWEEHAAVAAAVQNMALAAHGLGLRSIWRSGSFTELASVHNLLGVNTKKGDQIMAFFYVGHPDPEKQAAERMVPNWQSKTTFHN